MTFILLRNDRSAAKNHCPSAVRRMRERYGQLVREEIANTVWEPSQIDDESRHLMQVVGK